MAGLVDGEKKKVFRQSLMEFISHGLHYVFPLANGKVDTGIAATADKPKKKPTYVAINNSFPILQDPRFKTVEGILRFKQIPW